MKFIYFILICFVFCSCTTIPRVVKPVNLQSYDKYKNPDNLQIDEAKKKKRNSSRDILQYGPTSSKIFLHNNISISNYSITRFYNIQKK